MTHASSRKVDGSIREEITGFFNLLNLSSGTMDVESNRPLMETYTRNIPGGKGQAGA
jgi:hypothetical protein